MPVFIDDLLSRVEKPARYTGGEMNATTKSFDDADVTFAFCFPDTYEVAMSHLGMKIGYARAGRLIDDMANRGIVSKSVGSKPREVLITREEFEKIKETLR